MNFLITAIITLIAFFEPINALENDVEGFINVKDAEILVYDDYCIIAIKSDAIYSISDLNALYKDIEQLAFNKYNYTNVIVTRDNDIFYEVSKLNEKELNDESQSKKILDKAKKRYNKRNSYN